jgi:hypothetical protein
MRVYIVSDFPKMQLNKAFGFCNLESQRLNFPTSVIHSSGGTRWRSLLRHCTTSRKKAGSIPDEVIAIFHWLHSSGPIVALRSTQPVKMSTRTSSWGAKARWCVRLTTLPPSCADCLEIWEPQPPGTLRACSGLCRDSFTFNIFQCLGNMLWKGIRSVNTNTRPFLTSTLYVDEKPVSRSLHFYPRGKFYVVKCIVEFRTGTA